MGWNKPQELRAHLVTVAYKAALGKTLAFASIAASNTSGLVFLWNGPAVCTTRSQPSRALASDAASPRSSSTNFTSE